MAEWYLKCFRYIAKAQVYEGHVQYIHATQGQQSSARIQDQKKIVWRRPKIYKSQQQSEKRTKNIALKN